jgi:hypothetical protein
MRDSAVLRGKCEEYESLWEAVAVKVGYDDI